MVTMFDPDAPTGVGYTHWTIFDIPPTVTSLPHNAGASNSPGGGIAGYTDNQVSAYGGPCPPVGDPPHHYWFTVSALNVASLQLTSKATFSVLNFVTRGEIIAQGQIVGRYGR
jgi:Raf kinase inhibitor-like YbhB/YbcL family protein